MHTKLYCVYIVTNKWNTTFYIGMSGRLKQRIYEHKKEVVKSFTQRYQLHKLVYYECFDDVNAAAKREKKLKGWRRDRKINLIIRNNPQLKDLYDDLEND
ncbi:MAG: GIY-YIG nuclease family protein [Patescibacteria group bacterium]